MNIRIENGKFVVLGDYAVKVVCDDGTVAKRVRLKITRIDPPATKEEKRQIKGRQKKERWIDNLEQEINERRCRK